MSAPDQLPFKRTRDTRAGADRYDTLAPAVSGVRVAEAALVEQGYSLGLARAATAQGLTLRQAWKWIDARLERDLSFERNRIRAMCDSNKIAKLAEPFLTWRQRFSQSSDGGIAAVHEILPCINFGHRTTHVQTFFLAKVEKLPSPCFEVITKLQHVPLHLLRHHYATVVVFGICCCTTWSHNQLSKS